MLEVTLFVTLFFVFCAAPSLLVVFWLTVGHLPRGVLGFFVLRYLPQSHDIVQNLDLESLDHGTLTLDKLQDQIKFTL